LKRSTSIRHHMVWISSSTNIFLAILMFSVESGKVHNSIVIWHWISENCLWSYKGKFMRSIIAFKELISINFFHNSGSYNIFHSQSNHFTVLHSSINPKTRQHIAVNLVKQVNETPKQNPHTKPTISIQVIFL